MIDERPDPQQPATGDRAAWRAFWSECGQALSRADVEWLLAAHDDTRGPIDCSDEAQRSREGLDLRGADLRGADL